MKLFLGKAVLLVDFAHLLLQNNGHVDSMEKNCFEAVYTIYFRKKQTQKQTLKKISVIGS